VTGPPRTTRFTLHREEPVYDPGGKGDLDYRNVLSELWDRKFINAV